MSESPFNSDEELVVTTRAQWRWVLEQTRKDAGAAYGNAKDALAAFDRETKRLELEAEADDPDKR